MEHQDIISSSSHRIDAATVFPLGAALLLVVIFCLSGVLSCYCHWGKLGSASSNADLEANTPNKLTSTYPSLKMDQRESLPVLMPGDNIPRFIAMPCPCQPPHVLKTDAIHIVGIDVKLPVAPTVDGNSHIII
ncbi:hypothetical protein MKW98_029208 [Papaver atlanticum]|uniref:Hydroxyproline-rich glycoprotein family protein n=1 Tax=Papaver atlanticum TaxID=357466 RepID=A0AAD4T2V1_9MAGN|nr:hypothetical protein MKW98_029208 [Papaver atlanticum]